MSRPEFMFNSAVRDAFLEEAKLTRHNCFYGHGDIEYVKRELYVAMRMERVADVIQREIDSRVKLAMVD